MESLPNSKIAFETLQSFILQWQHLALDEVKIFSQSLSDVEKTWFEIKAWDAHVRKFLSKFFR